MTRDKDTPQKKSSTTTEGRDVRNPDPITGEKGAHPVGTGLGAAVGGATVGAVTGSLAGPVGTVAGAIVGGVAGGYAGKAISEEIHPTFESESEYWRENYASSSYYNDERSYEEVEPAYRFGWENVQDPNQTWESQEIELKRKWEENRWENEGGAPGLTWEEARTAGKEAYDRRVERSRAGDQGDCGPCDTPKNRQPR